MFTGRLVSAGKRPVVTLQIGTAILRRYVLLRPIGRGGVSVVYQAVDTQSPRALAVKVLAPASIGDGQARESVRREALITERLRHPCVPRVYDFGVVSLADGTLLPYVVMELLTGVTLAVRLIDGALPWREAVRIAASAADVLAVAHRRGVVHRDLTPNNIMMTAEGIKIIDFGLATTIDGLRPGTDRPRVTRVTLPRRPALPPHPFIGSGCPTDDIYALGILLYQMLTGRSPYPSASPRSPLAGVRFSAMAPTPVLSVAGLPPKVADICRACMCKRAEQRPSGRQVALALWDLLGPDHRAELTTSRSRHRPSGRP